MKALSKTFVDALTVKQARLRLNFSQLSKLTGVDATTISKVINGKKEALQQKIFDKLNDWLL